jgi:histidyl-tRNA synthetase
MAQIIMRPRGTEDVLPSEAKTWLYVESAAREVSRLFGFKEIRFPTFEHTELFLRGVGDTTDIVQKEMYTFPDKKGRSITLRPEGTASVVRAIVEHSLVQAGLPIKVYYIAPNFRYEKPQKGRLREHHQFGIECFGPSGPQADVEVIVLGRTLLHKLGITGVRLELNSIGCPECRTRFNRALKDYFMGYLNELCDTCKSRLDRNPMRILDCKEVSCGNIAEGAPAVLDYLCPECVEHFEGVQNGLKAMGVEFSVNPRIVRGLDYYTRTVFEFVSTGIGAQGTVLGGGRYDGLVEELGGVPTPGLGFGTGIERLMLAMRESGSLPEDVEGPDLFIASADEGAKALAASLALELRGLGIAVEHDLMDRSLKAQMKYASRINAAYTIVLGPDEMASGKIRLRDMSSGTEHDCLLNAAEIGKCVSRTNEKHD